MTSFIKDFLSSLKMAIQVGKCSQDFKCKAGIELLYDKEGEEKNKTIF